MTALIVLYESMYGNTRRIADAIAEGLGAPAVHVAQATAEQVANADIVVIGGPTHAWHMTSPKTRQAAADAARKPGSKVLLERDATRSGIREWIDGSPPPAAAAVFDTRINKSRVLSGSAARHLAKRLRRKGTKLVTAPESFLVTTDNILVAGELARARRWGRQLADVLAHRAHT